AARRQKEQERLKAPAVASLDVGQRVYHRKAEADRGQRRQQVALLSAAAPQDANDADRGERIDDAGVHLIGRQPAWRVEQPGWLRQPPEVHELASEQARELLGPLLDETQRFLREDVVGLQLIGVPDAIAQIDGRGAEDVLTRRQPARSAGHRVVALPDVLEAGRDQQWTT